MMDHALRLELVALLLKIPDIEDFATRTDLLAGLPNRTSLARSQTSARTDISRLIDQLASLYLQTGQWALSLLIENALTRLEQTTDEKELERLHQSLILSMHRTSSTGSASLPAKKQRSPSSRKKSEKPTSEDNDFSKVDRSTIALPSNMGQASSKEKIEIVIMAAPKDAKYCRQVLTAIEGVLQFLEKKELVRVWHKGLIPSGSITAQVSWEHIQAARIILLLMSRDFLADNFYKDRNNYMEAIIQRSKLEGVRVIPVLISPSSWKHSPFGVLAPLPLNGTCLTMAPHKEKALQDIAESVFVLVKQMLASLPAEVPSPQETEIAQEKSTMLSSTFVHGHALLIGTGGSLPVTVDDAQRLGKMLEHSARAAYPSTQVEMLLENNATRTNILAAFDRLIERVSHDPTATVLIYFSGHGGKFARDGLSTEYFLIPRGYDPFRRRETAISDHELTTKIEAIQARKLVVLLDCCHAGGIPMLKDEEERFEKSPLPPELLQALQSGGGRVVVASSREGEKSQTDSHGSIFTHCLLEALRGKGTASHPDSAVRILDVLSYLFREVPQRTSNQQHPFVNKIANLDENFVLCYSQVQKKEESGNIIEHATPPTSAPLAAYQRMRLEKRLGELQSSLALYDEKVARLSRAVDIESDVLRQFQYQQQLFQELQKRTSIEEEMKIIIQQLQM